MAEPNCHYCDQPAQAQCPTCGRLYCDEHGDDVCLRCMAPESATPSAAMYKGSMLALIVASLIAVFLLVRPPESTSTADVVRPVATPTTALGATATPTRQGAATPSPATTATRAPGSNTAVPGAATPTAAPGGRTYTVRAGDTLGEIATANGTTVEALTALNPGLTENLSIDQVIKLP